MKRLIFIITLIVIAFNLNAQDKPTTPTPTPTPAPAPTTPAPTPAPPAQEKSNMHFGIKVVPSLAWLRTDSPNYNSDGSRFGFSYGLIMDFYFAPHYAFATGLDVTYRGGKLTEPTYKSAAGDTTIITKANYSLQYIEIPVSLKFTTNEIGYMTYFLQVGVEPGVNIRARRSYEKTIQINSGTPTTDNAENVDYMDNINNFNLSMIVGGGIEYTISGSTSLVAGIQFSNGFVDTFDDDPKVNSNYLGLLIGVLF